MKTVMLSANWQPQQGFKLGLKDVEGKLTYLGSQVWKDPQIKIADKEIPSIGPEDVLIKVKACGICGSDVHMAQSDDRGYILYPEYLFTISLSALSAYSAVNRPFSRRG